MKPQKIAAPSGFWEQGWNAALDAVAAVASQPAQPDGEALAVELARALRVLHLYGSQSSDDYGRYIAEYLIAEGWTVRQPARDAES